MSLGYEPRIKIGFVLLERLEFLFHQNCAVNMQFILCQVPYDQSISTLNSACSSPSAVVFKPLILLSVVVGKEHVAAIQRIKSKQDILDQSKLTSPCKGLPAAGGR